MTVLLTLSFLALGAEVVVPPAKVTVFADRARVTRTARVDLAAGRQEVVFTGLPTRTLPQGVTADARGGGTLLGVDMKRVTATEVADVRVKEIDAELERLGDRRQDLDDRINAARAQLTGIGGALGESAQALSLQLLVGTRAPLRARALRLALAGQERRALDAIRATNETRRDLLEEIGKLQRERGTLGSSGTDTWTATVHLELPRPARVDVDVAYMVPGATWRPRYDLRGDASAGKVELALSALVTQATGEDWKGVELTVSSARPSLGTTVPVLDPFFLQRPRPRPRPAPPARSGGARAESAAMPMDMAPEPMMDEEVPMEVAVAKVAVQLASTAFTVTRGEDIPSDGTERKVLLTTERLDAKLRHVVAPRVEPRAYLVGEVANTTSFPLLPGEAGVFLAGAYLGDFQLDLVAPKESFDVAFGVDDRVRVTRTPVKIERDEKIGVGGRRARSSWTWKVEIRNGHPRPIAVQLWEQVPLSPREDVKVELISPSRAPQAKDGGLLEFLYDVAPSRTDATTWGYQVEYPSDVYLEWME